jgi:O-antigen/teichoic acid export membrane protein
MTLTAILTKITKFRESKVAKNTSVLLAGQVISRLMQIVYVAALARYVGTEGVGKISTATALTALVVFMVGPGLTTLLVRDVAANRRDAPAYIGNTFFVRLVLGVPFIVLTMAVGCLAGYPRDTLYIVFIYTIVYFFDALGQLLSSVFQAFEVMEYDALTQVIRDLINVILSLTFIFLRLPLLLIVLASAIAQVCKFGIMIGIIYRKVVPIRPTFSLEASKALLIKSLPFSALVILLAVRFQIATFVLSLYDSVNIVGIYSSATTLLLMLLMLASAFSSAVLPAFSRMYKNDRANLARVYQLSYKYLMLTGFPIGAAAMLFGGKIIVLLYGAAFKDAGVPMAILAVSLLTMMSYSNGPLLNAIGKQRFFAWTQALFILAQAIFCLIFIPLWGAIGAALATMLSGLLGFSVHSVACHRQVGLPMPWLSTAKALFATSIMGAACILANYFGIAWWLVALTIMPCAYILPVFLLKLVRADELKILAGQPAGDKGI